MTTPLILSGSTINAYLSCQYRYLLRYVYRVPSVPSVAAAIGTAVMAGIETLHTKPLESAQDALRAAFWSEVEQIPDAPDLDPPDTVFDGPPPSDGIPEIIAALTDAFAMLALYQREVAPIFHPTMVERSFLITVNGIGFSGQIDTADEDTDDLREVKTTAGKTINGQRRASFAPARHDFQLTGYAIAYEYLTGRKPKHVRIDLLTRRPAYRQYDREVRIGEFVAALEMTAEGIDRGEFRPTGAAAGECRFCDVKAACQYRVED